MNLDFERLLAAYLDEKVNPEELARLANWVQTDPALRKRFQEEMRLAVLSREVARERLALPNTETGHPIPSSQFQAQSSEPHHLKPARGAAGSRFHFAFRVGWRRTTDGAAGARLQESHKVLAVDWWGRRLAWALAACLALALGVASLWMNRPPELGSLSAAAGQAELLRKNQIYPVLAGQVVREGDRLRTGSNGTLRLLLTREKAELVMAPGTELLIENSGEGARPNLRWGKITGAVPPQEPGRPLVVQATRARLEVVGTQFDLAAREAGAWLRVREGKVRLVRLADESSVMVKAGEFAAVEDGLPFEIRRQEANRPAALPVKLDYAHPRQEGDGDWSWDGLRLEQKRVSRHPFLPENFGTSKSPIGVLEFPAVQGGSIEMEAAIVVRETLARIEADASRAFSVGFRFRQGDWLYQARYGTLPEGRAHLVLDADLLGRGLPPVKMASAEAAAQWLPVGEPWRLRVQALAAAPGWLRIRMKAWAASTAEPAQWMLDHGMEAPAGIDRAGLQTTSAAAVFTDWKINAVENFEP